MKPSARHAYDEQLRRQRGLARVLRRQVLVREAYGRRAIADGGGNAASIVPG